MEIREFCRDKPGYEKICDKILDLDRLKKRTETESDSQKKILLYARYIEAQEDCFYDFIEAISQEFNTIIKKGDGKMSG